MRKAGSKVLLLRLSALGDGVMMLPLLRQASVQFPEKEFIAVLPAAIAPLAERIPRVTAIPFQPRSTHKGAKGLWHLSKEIASLGPYSALADCHSVIRTWAIRAFLIPLLNLRYPRVATIRKGRREKRALCRVNNPLRAQLPHSILRYAATLQRLSLPLSIPHERGGATIPTELQAKAEALLASHSRWIGIAPFAKHPGKCYLLERLQALAMRLTSEGYGVALLGGGATERALLQTWVEAGHAHLNLPALGLSLEGELAVMARLEAVVCMDSANMHLASWAGTPAISIWGATSPLAGFAGWGQPENLRVERNDLPCRPCSVYGSKPCRFQSYECLDIPIEAIYERLEALSPLTRR